MKYRFGIIRRMANCANDIKRVLGVYDPEKVWRGFDGNYAALNDRKYVQYGFCQEYGALLGPVRIDASSRVIDYGCNTGRLAGHLHELHGCDVIGFDINSSALALAKAKYPGVAFENLSNSESVERIVGNGVDVVVMTHSLAFVRDDRAVMRKIYGWLKPDGIVAILTPNGRFIMAMTPMNLLTGYTSDQGRYRDYTIGKLRELLFESGFDSVNIDTLGEYPRWLEWLRPRSARSRLIAYGVKSAAPSVCLRNLNLRRP